MELWMRSSRPAAAWPSCSAAPPVRSAPPSPSPIAKASTLSPSPISMETENWTPRPPQGPMERSPFSWALEQVVSRPQPRSLFLTDSSRLPPLQAISTTTASRTGGRAQPKRSYSAGQPCHLIGQRRWHVSCSGSHQLCLTPAATERRECDDGSPDCRRSKQRWQGGYRNGARSLPYFG